MSMHANPVGKKLKDIYIIKNDINNKVYIGQSVNAEDRFKSHCKPSSKTHNSLIDLAIQKYGKEHFWFEILEEQIDNYNEREKYWIKYYQSTKPHGYNILEGGQEPPVHYGDDHVNTKISDEQVKNLKQELRNTTISLNDLANKYGISKKQVLRINQGISRSSLNETYPIRKNPNINGKLTEEQVNEIIELLKYTYRFNGDIAREYQVDIHTISDINSGQAHHRETESYPIRAWKSCGTILFTYEEVTEIIQLLKNTNISINEIAKRYNVDRRAIVGINTGSSKKYKRDNLQYPIRPY